MGSAYSDVGSNRSTKNCNDSSSSTFNEDSFGLQMKQSEKNVDEIKAEFDRIAVESSAMYQVFSIPNDLLIDILSFVPAGHLIKNCRLVCRQWKEIIDSHCLWKQKCELENMVIPSNKPATLPPKFYQFVYFHNKYEKNLVKNPSGEDRFEHWELIENGADGFAIENPPKGADPVPAEVGTQSCYATSYGHCRKLQLIDLYEHEFNKYLLKHDIVKIEVGGWHAARFDCGSIYGLCVRLLDEKKEVLDSFVHEYREEQWVGKAWNCVTHVFENAKKARYVRFEDFGVDTQFWAGHYGSKMTGAFVKLCIK